MIRLVIVGVAAMGLILLVAFVAARLLRSRTSGVSIRMQMFLALASIVGAFAFGLGLLVIDRIGGRASLLGEEAARDEATAVSALIAGEMLGPRPATFDEVALKLGRGRAEESPELHLTLLDLQGRSVFSSGPAATSPGTVSATVPVIVHGRSVGMVRVVKPTIMIRRLLADFAPTILVISLVLGAVAALAAAIIGRAIATPIESLTDFAERVSEGERRASPPAASGREVQRLMHAIDTMRRELEGRPFVETFAADLSHELKNPVAAIRASAEVLADGALEEPEEAARFVRRIREATTRIEALLGDLLSLARIEARGVEHAEVVDLMTIARDVAARARERGTDVEVDGADGEVRGDAMWLGRALENLVENARMHGDSGTSVRVVIAREADNVTVRVRNRGQLGAAIAKRLFRRFATTRADRGGTGLGLAIVRAVAEAHGGSATCPEKGPPEVEFAVTLPAR